MAVLAAAMPLLVLPAESRGCWFRWLCGRRATPTYQPVAAAPAPACTTCQPQTVQYVPQTCYRAVVQNVPVTTCRAVTTCDPCTGCPVTTMRPVTTYVQQVRYVPYTTYRAVAMPATCATTPSYAAPAYAAPGCATGACGSASPSYSAPATGTPTYAPPAGSTPTPALTPSPGAPASSGQGGTPQTFKNQPVSPGSGGGNDGQPSSAVGGGQTEPAASSSGYPAFPPSNAKSTNDRRPKLFDPRDRTAANGVEPAGRVAVQRVSVADVRPAVHVQPVHTVRPTAVWSQEEIDAAGWRAASR